jgi:hypothetical protein
MPIYDLKSNDGFPHTIGSFSLAFSKHIEANTYSHLALAL